MPIRTAFYDRHFGRLDVYRGRVDVMPDGDVQFAVAPDLGVGSETVLTLDEFQRPVHRLPYLPRPFGAGFERSCKIAFIDDFHCLSVLWGGCRRPDYCSIYAAMRF